MQWITIVLKIIPMLAKLMAIAEQAFDEIPDSGAQKKQMVIEAIKALVEGLAGVTFTPELWAKIQGVIDPVINIAAAFLFPHDEK